MDAHHFNVAQEWLKRALELLPVEKDSATISSFILRLLAKCFSELGDHNMAVKTIEAAFEVSADNRSLWRLQCHYIGYFQGRSRKY